MEFNLVYASAKSAAVKAGEPTKKFRFLLQKYGKHCQLSGHIELRTM
jgi:hypothetical protein